MREKEIKKKNEICVQEERWTHKFGLKYGINLDYK